LSEDKPRFYTHEDELFCDWRGRSFRVIEVAGERFLVPASVWEREDLRPSIERALEAGVQLFREALDRGVPYEDARYLLPEGSMSRLEFEGTVDF
jgi:thymidylate synthase (FAD)